MKIMKFSEKRLNKEDKKIDLTEIKKLDEKYRKELREAAFRKGMASKMVGLISSVLSKRTGFKIGISTVAIETVIGSGTYDTYFGYIAPQRAFRLNFLKGRNESLSSIDFYNSNTDLIPSIRLDLNGFNIVQVIDQVADYITGEYDRYDEDFSNKRMTFNERRLGVRDMVHEWLVNNPSHINDIKNDRFDYEKFAPVVLNYMKVTYGSGKNRFSSGALKRNVFEISMENKGLGLNSKAIPVISVDNVTTNEFTPPTKELQEIWDAAMNVTPKQIMETLEEDTRRIARGDKLLPGLLVYGKPGTGKTQTITDVLKDEGVKPVIIDEKLTAYSRLLWALYDNRTNQILIIDDNDSIFDNEQNVDLLKKVLDMKPVRRIELSQPVKIFGSDNTIEGSFDFDSKMIFISNRIKMDNAIKSRLSGVMHELNFTKEEMLDLIKGNLYNLYKDIPSITDDMREDVFDFVESILPGISDIDYRAFNFCITYCQSARLSGQSERVWKERSVRLLREYGKDVKGKRY